MRIFPGTNVLLAAFFGSCLCRELVQRLLDTRHTLLIGEPVAREFVRIATTKFHVAPTDLAHALETLRRMTPAPASDLRIPHCPDPDDAPILACASRANAEIFVTGDKALLGLDQRGDMAIVSPRVLYERLLSGS